MNWRVWIMSAVRRGNLAVRYKRALAFQYAGNETSVRQEMEDNARKIFLFHVSHNPGYRRFLDEKGFDYSDPEHVAWETIPIITKQDLIRLDPVVDSEVYNYSSSRGSTQKPFRYAASKESALFIWPHHWVLHRIFGVRPYSRGLMLMEYGNDESLKKRLYHRLSNFTVYSAFRMDDTQMHRMYEDIKRRKIRFIYGFSSAVNQFLRYLRDNDLHVELKGIVTTSDNRIGSSYELARRYCGCEVFDQYGAHDGDVFAFECEEHCGLHIMHDVCTIEIIDGHIITTAVQNRAYPFIRYDVGDMARGERLITERCRCGRPLYRLEGLSGRITDYIEDGKGGRVTMMFVGDLLSADFGVDQYQMYEKDGDLYLNVVTRNYTAEELTAKYMSKIEATLKRKVRIVLNEPVHKLPSNKVPAYIKLQ